MNIEAFSTKWFVFYYIVVGLCLLGGGLYLILKKRRLKNFLLKAADDEKPPWIFIRILKYFLFFTLPGLVLSFTPFSWIELLYTIWSLLLVYLAGIQLLRWDQDRALIKANPEQLPDIISRSGAMMVALSFAIFLLAYLALNQSPL